MSNREKATERKQHARQADRGRDYHSCSDKEVKTVPEGAKSKHPENKKRV
jgi:hypothetical protein